MSNTNHKMFQIYCDIIEQFSPCMNDYLYIIDLKNDQYYISKQACKRFALPDNHFNDVVKTHSKFVYQDDYTMLLEDFAQILSGTKKEHNLKYRWIGSDGNPIWINCRGRLIKDGSDGDTYMIGCINEIGNKQMADNISGLLGEISFINAMNEIHSFPKGFLLRIGIDDFKKINEKNGIQFGDQVLQQVAQFITQCTKPTQTVYRIVADEFIITDFSDGTLEDAKDLYNQIRAKVDDSLEEQQYDIVYTISAGILTSEDIKSYNYEDLLKLSQFALSQAKFFGKNQYYHFKEDDYNAFLRRRTLEKILRNSIASNFEGFYLNYQPIVNSETENPVAAEALLRFTTTCGEAISPAELIPCLEETGLIIPVGKWIIRTALSAGKEFCLRNPKFKVAINLSYIQLQKSAIYDDIKEALHAIGIDGSNVIVELTESGNLENNINITNTWNKLKKIGVSIAVDDFGSGYSNFSHIGDLHPDYVKIDHQFTFKAFKNEYDFLLLTNLIQMAHNMKLRFVIEGIERKEEVEKMKEFHPGYIQGFYYSRPCDKETFIEKFLTD